MARPRTNTLPQKTTNDGQTGTGPLLTIIRIDVNQKPLQKIGLNDISIQSDETGWFLSRPLKPDENNVAFHFNAIDMHFPGHMLYRHFLEGTDKKWSEKSPLNLANYTCLSPGNHIFRVQAFTENGEKSEVKTVRFSVREPFWNLGWATPLIGAILVLSGACLVTWKKWHQEITERRKVEEALRTSEERYSLIAHTEKTGGWDLWLEGEKFFSDIHFKLLLGYEDHELTQQDLDDWLGRIPSDDRAKVREAFQRIHDNFTDPYSMEHRALRKDGSIAWLRVNGKVVKDANTVRLIGTITDITHQKQANDALRESEERYRLLVENASIGIALMNTDCTIIMANPAVGQQFSKTASEFVGKKCFQEFQKQNLVCKDCPVHRTMDSKTPEMVETKGSRNDGTCFYMRSKAVPIFDGNGQVKGLIEFVEDITDFKQNEISLKKNEAEYRELVKELAASLREKEVLLREIHHRVKNNLQIITSLLRSQSRQLKDEEMLNIFRESQNRIKAMALIHETLFQSSDLSHVDFNTYVSKLAETLFEAFGVKKNEIRLTIRAKGFSLVIDDAIPLGLVVNELLTNALKYAFPDARPGEIKIIMATLDDDQIELTVSDNGVGLPEDMDFRSAETLGLVLVSGLVEVQLDGRLELSRTGGTQFIIRFRQETRKG